MANAVVLLVSVGAIAWEAIQRFQDPQPVAGNMVMLVAGAGIVVNGVTAWLFSRGHDDINIRGVFVHMMGDAAVSLGVVLSALVIGLTGWLWLDPATSLVISVLIAIGTWGLLRESVQLVVDGVPASTPSGAVAAYLRALPGVLEVHDLHIWGLSTSDTALTAHLVRDAAADDQALIAQIVHDLAERFRIGHVTLQMESPETAADCRLRPDHVI